MANNTGSMANRGYTYDVEAGEMQGDKRKNVKKTAAHSGSQEIEGNTQGNSSTYRYRNKKARKNYMKDYMRRRREK